MTEATSASAKAVTLGNLAETMPDIVASMTSNVGILGTQEQNLCSTRGEMSVGGREMNERGLVTAV